MGFEGTWIFFIQDVQGGKVNILGGHTNGHSKQKALYEHVSYSERFPRYSHLNVNRKTTDSHASDSGAAWRERKTTLGAQAKLLYSQMALSWKPFGIGHVHINIFA
jgi:hypothetical protein